MQRNDTLPQVAFAPQGGLCNRLRVLLSAWSRAAEGIAETSVEWGRDDGCHAWFDQLFCPLEAKHLTVHRRRWWARPITRRNLHWPWLLRHCMGYDRQAANYLPGEPRQLARWVRQYRKIYVSGGSVAYPYDPALLRSLRPVTEVARRIEQVTTHFTPHTVGVHIRRTDNAISCRESSTPLFVDAMNSRLAADPQTSFFLATDDATLKQQLVRRFDGRILTLTDPVTRSSLAGMKHAVVDLYCLARTSGLIGSYWSSFTDTAAELGGMPVTIVRG